MLNEVSCYSHFVRTRILRLLQVKLNNPGDYYFVTIKPHMIQSLLKQELQESGSIYSAINLSNVIPLHVGDLTNDSVYDNQIPSNTQCSLHGEHCLSVILSVSPQLLIWVLWCVPENSPHLSSHGL
jgi:hypothetical protein